MKTRTPTHSRTTPTPRAQLEKTRKAKPAQPQPASTNQKPTHKNALVIAISSRALFDLKGSHAVFEKEGVDAYAKYQTQRENEPLGKGVFFAMVEKFLAINDAPGKRDKNQRVEVVLLSRNSADTGLRIFNSIAHYQLDITNAAFTGGQSAYPYAKPFGAHLFLSADPVEVRNALTAGIAAATMLPAHADANANADTNANAQLKIAFDGDAVLFSDEAEQIYQRDDLSAFHEHEIAAADKPLPSGPFKQVLTALHAIQQNYPADASPIRTALFTARGAPAHKRVIKTLRAWKIRIDESYFLGGKDKSEFLREFGADIFFDDQRKYCDPASRHVPTGHVPHGVVNS